MGVELTRGATEVVASAFSGGITGFAFDGLGQPSWTIERETLELSQTLGGINAASFFGIFSHLADGSNLQVVLYDASSREARWTYEPESESVKALLPFSEDRIKRAAVSADGRRLALAVSLDDSEGVLFFDAESPMPIARYRGAGVAQGNVWLQFTPDGDRCLYRSHGALERLDFESGRRLSSFRPDSRQTYLTTNYDGSLLVDPRATNRLDVYRQADDDYAAFWSFSATSTEISGVFWPGPVVIGTETTPLIATWVSDDDQQILLSRFSLSCRPDMLWSFRTPAGRGRYVDGVSALKLSADGRWLAVGTRGTEDKAHPEFLLFDLTDGEDPVFTLDTKGSVNSIDMTPDGRRIAIAARAVHANVVAGGGGVYAVEIMDP